MINTRYLHRFATVVLLTCSILFIHTKQIFAQNYTVTYTLNGFSPQTLTIQKGDTVTWTKSSVSFLEVASDPHPIHTNYPPLNLGLISNDGDTKSLTFIDVGTFGYHNHLSEQHTGTIIVNPTNQTVTPTKTGTPTPTIITKQGDANKDGKVDGIDFVIWINHYGQTTSRGYIDADFNNDTKVDGIDYTIWLFNYGK